MKYLLAIRRLSLHLIASVLEIGGSSGRAALVVVAVRGDETNGGAAVCPNAGTAPLCLKSLRRAVGLW